MKFRFLFLIILSIACFAVSPSTTEAALLSRSPNNLGLIGYWPMNEGAGSAVGDASGNGSTGTLLGTTWVNGKYGKALSFDGSAGSYVDVSNDSRFGLSSSVAEMTISAWIKTTALNASIVGIRNTGNGNPVFDFQLGNDGLDNSTNGIPSLLVRGDADGLAHIHGTTAINDNQWHHVVAVRNSSKDLHIYVDGVMVANGSDTMSTGQTMDDVRIGDESQNPAVTNMDGYIDDVRIYNRALGLTEVVKLYQSGAVRSNASSADLTDGTTLENGLVGLWTMDGKDTLWGSNTMTDRSGNSNTGTIRNMSTSSAPVAGRLGQALKFDGADDYVDTGILWSASDVNLTVSAWIKTTVVATAPDQSNIIGSYSGGNEDIELYIQDGKLVGFVRDTSGAGGHNMNPISPGTINDGVWHHVSMVVDGTTASLYIDGVFSTSATGVSFTGDMSSSATIAIGGQAGILNPGLYFNGSIDDVRIYNRALSVAEIKQLYNLGGGKVNTSQNKTGGTIDSGLIGLWSFNGADMNWGTNEALDRSGNGYNADIINMSTTTSPVPGKIGQALKFNGTTNSVDTGYMANNADDYYTMSAWVKTTYSGTDVSIIDNYDTSVPYLALYMISSGAMQTYARNNSYGWTATGNTLINDNVWHHVAMTMSTDGVNDILTIYVDGVQDGTPATRAIGVGGDFDSGSAFHIGSDGQSNYKFPGSIDEARIYNRALTASEIKQLYNMGR